MTAPPALEPQSWMTAPPTRAVLAAFAAAGAEARFVGGCVRDGVLGRPVKDVDLATPAEPEAVVALLEAAGLRAVPTGIAHGTVTAVAQGQPFEITTLRHDVETYGRHAKVAFTEDWEADAARRDFTMNAMFADPDGQVTDFFGGYDDLRAGRVKFVGDAHTRLVEDVLRLLRFYRFHAHYGRGEADPEGRAACRAMVDKLPTLSIERVRDETLKLLRAQYPAEALLMMQEDGALARYLPEAAEIERTERVDGSDPILRLALLLADGTDGAAVGRRLKLSNDEIGLLDALTRCVAEPVLPEDIVAARRGLHRFGVDRFMAMVGISAVVTENIQAAIHAANARDTWTNPRLPVAGKDLAALGVAPGPEMGDLLKRIEAWWIESDFSGSREQALERIKRLIDEKKESQT